MYCTVCLSSNRILSPLPRKHECINIFLALCNSSSKVPQKVLLCWECAAILNKIKQFRYKVNQAQKILSSCNQSKQKPISLSSLTIKEQRIISIVNEDAISIKEENATSIHPESYARSIENNINEDNKIYDIQQNGIYDNDKVGEEHDMIKEEFTADVQLSAGCDELNYDMKDDESKTKVKRYSKYMRNAKRVIRHKNADNLVKCDYCGKNYKSIRVLEKHIRNHSSTHMCGVCNIKFKTKGTLRRHIDIKHVTISTEDAYCVQCDTQFINATVYRRHISTSVKHARERNGKPSDTKVPCPECGKIYTRKGYMMNHLNFVHRNASKYYCGQCDKQFLNRTKYIDHMKYLHEGKKRVKDKMCDICGRGFAIKRTLINHIRTHSGERPYQCQHCSSRFIQKYAMHIHIKHVHGIKKRDGSA